MSRKDMKVSIVIPTFNCSGLLRDTLNSIRLCGWNDIEIIIRDGGSEDDTVMQAGAFDDLPITVVSEPDNGQYDAINKGLAAASGEILCWINAGDVFLPGAVGNVVDVFSAVPEVKWITGRQCVAEDVKIRRMADTAVLVSDFEIKLGLCNGGAAGHLQQEGMFWSEELWAQAGPLDLSFNLAGDFELWTRFARVAPLYRLRIPLAAFSYHHTNRSIVGFDDYRREVRTAIDRFPPRIRLLHKLFSLLPVFWRASRRVPVFRGVFSLFFHFVRVLPIRIISYERRGSRFAVVCESRSAWVG